MRYILCLIMLFSCSISKATGLGEPFFNTPYGHVICACDNISHPNNEPSIIGFDTEIPRIQQFYFYQTHIIGYSDSLFFIFNESTEQLELFEHEKDWHNQIEIQNLKPLVTRWLTLADSPNETLLILFLGFYVTVPLACLYVFFFFKTLIHSIRIEKFNLVKGRNTKIFLLLLIFLCWLLSKIFWIESF